MANLFSTAELDDLQSVQEYHMQDSCIIMKPVGETSDNFGQLTILYQDSDELFCGLKENTGKEARSPIVTEMQDGELRLPIGTDVGEHYQVRITKRFGVALSPEKYFEITGIYHRGPSGLVVGIRQILPNTRLSVGN